MAVDYAQSGLKSEEPEHLEAIWSLLSEYRDWLTTARTNALEKMEPLQIRPVLVLTGESDAQKGVFYDRAKVGERLLVFGATKTNTKDPAAAPEVLRQTGRIIIASGGTAGGG